MGQKKTPKRLRPTPADTRRVMARFEKRHRTADNPRRDEFPDLEAPGAELAVVFFARNHRKALPRLARRAEAIDRLVLIQQLRLLLDREELAALLEGSEAGATWRQMGDPLGITTKNGTVQRDATATGRRGARAGSPASTVRAASTRERRSRG